MNTIGRVQRFVLMLLGVSLSSSAFAQEVCGLQNVAYNNLFENGFEVLLKNARHAGGSTTRPNPMDAGKPAGFAPVPTLGSPTIAITGPVAGLHPGRRLQIRGTIAGPINTGVSVNGMPAFVQNGQFVTPVLTLPTSGSTLITATATTMDGVMATDSRTLTTGAADSVYLTVKPAEFPNRQVRFSLGVGQGITIQQLTLDFDGDGVPDHTGVNPLQIPAHTYSAPGFYTAEARVTTAPPNSQVIVSKVILAILDPVELRTRACSVYGALRARLVANDVNGAIKVFPEESRPPFLAMFNSLGMNRPTFAGRLGTIATGLLTLQSVSLTILTDENGPKAYKVRVAQAVDGVWRIEEM